MATTYLQEDLNFLLELHRHDVHLKADGNELVCDAPVGALQPEMREYIVRNKKRLLTLCASLARDEQLPKMEPDPERLHVPFPLTENQEAYWLGRTEGLESGGVGIHMFFELEMTNFDKERFDAAWNKVIQRHPMLRAVILPEGRQQILEEIPWYAIEEEFLSPGDEARLDAISREVSHMRYTLFHWPQFRFKVVHLAPGEGETDRKSVLLGSIDAWCVDLRSMQVLCDDLSDCYLGVDPAPAPAAGFREYLLGLQELREMPVYQKALAYWRRRIPALPKAPDLPLRPHAQQSSRHFTRSAGRLSGSVWGAIRNKIRERDLTASSVLLACYASVLSRWSSEKHFTLNVPRYNRLPIVDRINDIVGEFASFSLLEVDNRRKRPFAELAGSIQDQLWADLEYAHVSGVHVLREWKEHLGAAPSVMAPFVFTNEPEHDLSSFSGNGEHGAAKSLSWIGALERIGTVRNLLTQTPQVWIDSQFSEIDGELYYSWDSLDGVFPDGMIDSMFEAYGNLIRSLAEDEGWERTGIELPPGERELQMLLQGRAVEFPQTSPWSCIQRHAAERPGDAALIDGRGMLTWSETEKEVDRWKNTLASLGLGEGDVIAFALPKGRGQFIASMAINALGATIVPVYHDSPPARLRGILEDSNSRILLTESSCAGNFADLAFPLLLMDDPSSLCPRPLEGVKADLPEPLYCIIYTSGSTGTPKGVMVPLGGILNMVHDTVGNFGTRQSDRLLSLNPVYHDLAMFDIVGCAVIGWRLVFPDPAMAKDPAHWLQLVETHDISLWSSVPATMTMLLDYWDGEPGRKPLDSLQRVILGGDWLPLDTPGRLRRAAPGATLISIGGPTEVTVWNISHTVKEVDEKWRSIPYGLPVANAAYHLLDERLESCPVMVTGEMYCSKAGLTTGYKNDPEKTAEAFIIHPETETRLFRTGDLGRLHPDGYIEFIGRRDNQVNVNGYRIELGEIETAAALHDSVKIAVASVHERPGLPARLALWLTPLPGRECDRETILSHLKEHLPKYMLPSFIGVAEDFPLTANNKVDRALIRAWPLEGGQDAAASPPVTPVQKALAEVWQELLGQPFHSIDDNFFESGGNSIGAVRLYNKSIAGKYTGLSVASIFTYPTVRALAAAMEAATPVEPRKDDSGDEPDRENCGSHTRSGANHAWPTPAPLPVRLPVVPATLVQQRMFYEERRLSGVGCYNLGVHLGVRSEDDSALQAALIEEALNIVAQHNEILRTTFKEVEDQTKTPRVMQHIAPQSGLTLECHTRENGLPGHNPDNIETFCREFIERPYDLEQGPLLRAALVTDTQGNGNLIIGFHHIILDGWSLAPLLQDFARALENRPLSVRELQQADLAMWEYSPAFSAAVETTLPAMAERFPEGGTPSILRSLTPGRSVNDANGCCIDAYVPDSTVRRLGEISLKNGCTPFSLMFTLFGLAVGEFTDSDSVQIGTFVAARTLPELEDVLGAMTAPAPVALSFDRSASVLACAGNALRLLSEAMVHALLPFDRVIKEIAPPRAGDELPLFGIAFTYDNTPAETIRAGNIRFEPLGIRQYATSIDLEASVSQDSKGTRICMVYNPEKLDGPLVRNLLDRFVWLLEQAIEKPDRPVREFELSPPAETRARRGWALGKSKQASHENLLEYFYRQVRLTPDKPALIASAINEGTVEAAETLTYAQLKAYADAITVALRERGVGQGSRVALFLPRSVALFASIVGTLQCGASFIPAPLSTGTERLKHMLAISDTACICCDSRRETDKAGAAGIPLLHVDALERRSDITHDEMLASGRIFLPASEEEACLFFTSGSSGLPKGVRLSHGNLVNRLICGWEALPYEGEDVCIAKTQIGFIDIFSEFFQPLLQGVPVYVVPEEDEADPEKLLAHCAHWKVSRAMIVVSLIRALLETMEADGRGLPALKHVLSSGERLPPDVARRFYRLLPHAQLHNYYGSTEVTGDVACCIVPRTLDDADRFVAFGAVMANSHIEILNRNGVAAPPGVIGDICVSGPSVALGYADADGSRFFTHDGRRFFSMGDKGMWNERGEIVGAGRKDRQFKIRGQRVEAGEVETALYATGHVAEAAVIVCDQESDAKLAACYVPRKPEGLSASKLRLQLRDRLGGAMIPSLFFPMEALPKNSSGKTDYQRLLETVAAHRATMAERSEDSLRDGTERTLATLWETLLGCTVTDRHADFFTCGGHSLLAIRLMALIRESFGVPLKIRDIFNSSTLAELAEMLDLLAEQRESAMLAEPANAVEVI